MSIEELIDEVSAIEAIYPDSVHNEAPQIYTFAIPNHKLIKIQVNFPITYPDQSPELLLLVNEEKLRYTDTTYLEKVVKSVMVKTFVSGQVLMYELLSQLQEFLDEYLKERATEAIEPLTHEELAKQPLCHETPVANKLGDVSDHTLDWTKSDVITDRRSTFVAYAKAVENLEEATLYLENLLLDKRVSKAAHNISSWRIKTKDNISYQDCDDDGETAAGGRLLHLLQVRIYHLFENITNILTLI